MYIFCADKMAVNEGLLQEPNHMRQVPFTVVDDLMWPFSLKPNELISEYIEQNLKRQLEGWRLYL